jgi:hypothetical protein
VLQNSTEIFFHKIYKINNYEKDRTYLREATSPQEGLQKSSQHDRTLKHHQHLSLKPTVLGIDSEMHDRFQQFLINNKDKLKKQYMWQRGLAGPMRRELSLNSGSEDGV